MPKILFAIFLLFSTSFTMAQGTIEDALSLMEDQSAVNIQEKIYLHTDKASYTAGETIWFKLYSTIGVENFLSNFSKIAYIQLINPSKKIVTQIKIPVNMGISLGEVVLTDTLSEGSYHLRAYTNWMRNFGEEYFYDRVVNISNARTDNTLMQSSMNEENGQSFYKITLKTLDGSPLAKTRVNYEFKTAEKSIDKGRETTDEKGVLQIKLSEKTKNIPLEITFENHKKQDVKKNIIPKNFTATNSIQAFPEGGVLLDEVLNKIAFKTLKPDGLGIAARVHVLNDQQDTAGFLQTNELGMGSLSMYIEKGKKYTAHVEFQDQTKTTLDLPAASSSGYSLMVNNFNAQRLFAQVNLAQDKINSKPVYFILHHMGKVIHVSKQNASKKELVFSTVKKDFPTGLLTISILDDQLNIISERAIFNFNVNTQLPFSLNVDNNSPKKRTKINTNIETQNEGDTLSFTFLSASVVNLSKINDSLDREPNIYTDLLLNADLKGHIESPGYYFDKNNGVKSQELDDLLLTQGWRKIKVQPITSEDTIRPFPREQSLSIKGYARKLGRKAPEPNAKMKLVSTANYMDYVDTVANDEGYFVFDNMFFPDSVKFLIQAEDAKGKRNIDIFVDPETFPDALKAKNTILEKNNVNQAYAEDMSKALDFFAELENKGMLDKPFEIEEVVVKRRQNKASPNSQNLNGPGNADQTLSAEDLSTCSTLEMCLGGRLMGVTFQAGIPYNTRGNVPMQVVLDGMYIEGDQLNSLNVTDIQSIEVLRNINYTSIYGSYGANGLIIITSKTGADARSSSTSKGIITVMPKGINTLKEFYKPVYEVDSDKTFEKDYRTTIHWQPMIVIDKSGKSTFDFYTSDEPGTYRITLEGVDYKGRIGRKILEFEVK